MSDSERNANRSSYWASIFCEELFLSGCRTVCIAPGSRSTPLTMALARHGGFELFTIIDERSCAFFALGHAKASGEPVALVCTSGSAAVNFHPAVVEASYGQVPLIVLSADRPPELRDTGAGQAIDQLKLYGSAVRWFFEVGTPQLTASGLAHLRGLAARAVFEAQRPPAGPVHLNFPFRKPLEPIPLPGDVPEALQQIPAASKAHSRATPPLVTAAPETIRRLADQLRAAPRGLIVCGPMFSLPSSGGNGAGNGAGNWPDAVTTLARHSGYPVLAEPPSQLRGGTHDSSQIVAHGEAILRARAFRDKLKPQLVLRFGAMPTARHIEVLLEEHPNCPVVLVNESGAWLEPTHNPLDLICANPEHFCRALAEALPASSQSGGKQNGQQGGQQDRQQGDQQGGAWLEAFQEADKLAAEAIAGQYDAPLPEGLGGEWFEGRVFAELAGLLPANALQYTASSMPVRDLDAFTPRGNIPVRHLVNRGANGIDGTVSSALGAAAAAQKRGAGPAVLVTGDLAFYHDSNGLLAAKQYGLNLTIVLINNNGGGIFEMLPVSQFGETYEKHFGTPHGIDFSSLARAYDLPVLRPAHWEEFREMVGASLAGPGTRIVEIFTNRARNREQHEQVWRAVAGRLEQAFPAGRVVG